MVRIADASPHRRSGEELPGHILRASAWTGPYSGDEYRSKAKAEMLLHRERHVAKPGRGIWPKDGYFPLWGEVYAQMGYCTSLSGPRHIIYRSSGLRSAASFNIVLIQN